MPRREAIGTLPDDVRAWLDKSLIKGNFSAYEALEAELKSRGFQISKSAIHRYGQKFERRLSAIKASTEAARMLTEGASDDQDARSEAVIALVQTELFESIVNLQEASEEDVDPSDRIALLSKAAKNIATLSRASVNLKQYQAKVRAEDAAKLAQLEGEAKSGKNTLDLATIKRIREELYGIV
ncbi:MAG: DUF3486 family protein [Thiobacillus sp.]|jgi:hypothetical protein|uniref:DUF3486 family protein n=1 Tax=Thiobacillus sp. TaxID=924 RepID=UPI00289431E6|nr:DUF3486 family protein [Thiobacillus sp.]MDT3707437.1 DUF3486 family protein [Thiobacillus sp.]